AFCEILGDPQGHVQTFPCELTSSVCQLFLLVEQAGKVLAEKLDQAVGDWLEPDACVSNKDKQETYEAESTDFADTLNESSENALPVAEPLAGCQNDSLSDAEALKSASDQVNSIEEPASYMSPTGTCVVKESTSTLQDFTTHMEENECEQQIEDIESSHREDMWNNMHVLDLKYEDFQDVDLHDNWDDEEDYDLVLASYHEPRKMSYK
ncbi:hypothetical protein BHE74_00010881, partial [Ensete ventricosum]